MGAELIDLDRWAASYVALRLREAKAKQSERNAQVTRFGAWPIVAVAALTMVVVGLTSSFTFVIAPAVFVVVVVG